MSLVIEGQYQAKKKSSNGNFASYEVLAVIGAEVLVRRLDTKSRAIHRRGVASFERDYGLAVAPTAPTTSKSAPSKSGMVEFTPVSAPDREEPTFKPVKCGSLTSLFTPVCTSDSLPPDAPDGEWRAVCHVKQRQTRIGGFPMLVLEWRLIDDLTGYNGDFVGVKVTDFLVYYPGGHRNARASMRHRRDMYDALGLDLAHVTCIESWADLADLTETLEGLTADIYTRVEEKKDTDELVTVIRYKK